MAEPAPWFTRVGTVEQWVQRVAIPNPDGSGIPFLVTPKSGKLRISYVTNDNVRKYWNGTAFVTTAADVPTTISGKESAYSFLVPQELEGKVLTFEGWINDDTTTLDRAHVQVQGAGAEGYTLGF